MGKLKTMYRNLPLKKALNITIVGSLFIAFSGVMTILLATRPSYYALVAEYLVLQSCKAKREPIYIVLICFLTADYAVLVGESGEKFDESRIRSFAEESGISLSEWHSLDMLLLGREHQYMDASRDEWSPEIVVNVSDFNALSGMNLSVPDDGYIYFQDSDDSMFQPCSECSCVVK